MSIRSSASFIDKINWQKTIQRVVLFIGLGILVNLFFAYQITGSLDFSILSQYSSFWLLCAAFFALFPWLSHALEMFVWARFFKSNLKLSEAFQIAVITDLGAAITPTMIGGAPLKLGLLIRKGLKSGQAAAMTSFTAIEDVVFMLLVIPISIFYRGKVAIDIIRNILLNVWQKLPHILAIACLVVVVLGILYFLLKDKYFFQKIRVNIRTGLKDFIQSYKTISTDGKFYFLLAQLAIFTRWIARFMIVVCLAKGLSLQIPYFKLFISQWMIYGGMTFTPTPGAMGGAEILFSLVFKKIIPQELIGILMASWRFFAYYLVLITGLLFALFYSSKSNLFSKNENKPTL